LAAEVSVVVASYRAAHWRDLWALRTHQLAEHGVTLSPDAIPSQPLVVDRGDHEWDYHEIGQVYLACRGGFWLAWLDGTPAGHVGAQDLGEGVELRRMYVRQDFRRRGIGAKLVRELIAHCAARGVGAIELWTASGGLGRALYERVGFRAVTGPGPEFSDVLDPTRYEPRPDEIRMRLTPQARSDDSM
jgi:GNAT superfamily N-acetyltransferase